MTALAPARPLGPLRSAFGGIATRRAVLDYLAGVGLIMFILLIVAWTIDLSRTLPDLRADAAARGVPVLSVAVPYLIVRAADIVTRLLPMACFLGVFLAEIFRRLRLETVILQAAGATPLRMLAAVLIFAALAGPLQSRLERAWRPAAVAWQIDMGHGAYAERFRRGWTFAHHWVVSGDMAIRAEVLRDDPPAMRDVLIFTGIRAPQLKTVYSATRATPGTAPGQWVLHDGSTWQAAEGAESGTVFDELTLSLDLIPEQLRYFRVQAFYIPDAPLRALAAQGGARGAADANVAVWRRRTAWLLPGAFALFGFCLAGLGFAGRGLNPPRLIALAGFGYVTVVSVKVFWALGELGTLSAPAAVLAPLVFVLGLSAVLVWRQG